MLRVNPAHIHAHTHTRTHETGCGVGSLYILDSTYICEHADADTYDDSDADAAAYGGDELCAQGATVPPDPWSLD